MLNIRSQIGKDLHDELVRMIDEDVATVVSSRENWMMSLSDVRANYLGEPDDSRNLPWDGASEAHIPMTMIAVETAHPRIFSGVVGLDEIVTAVPGQGAEVEDAEDTTAFLNYVLRARRQVNAVPTIDKLLHNAEMYGKSISKRVWDYREREITQLYTRPRYQAGAGAMLKLLGRVQKKLGKRISPRQLEIPYQVHVQQLLGGALAEVTSIVNHSDRTTVEFRYLMDRELREGYAEIPTPGPNDLDIDVFLTVDTVIHNAPHLGLVGLADFYAPVNSQNLQDSKFNVERYYVTLNDLDVARSNGTAYFDDQTWTRILKQSGISGRYAATPTGSGEAEPDMFPGTIEDSVRRGFQEAIGDRKASDVQQGYLVYECYYRFRMPGDRAEREYVFFVLPEFHWIYRVVALEVLCPDKLRPYTSWDFMPDDDNSYLSLGIGHIIMDLQGIINDIFNKQMDRDDLINMPFGFYRPTSSIRKDMMKIAPGVLIPTSDPTSVVFPNWNRPNAADTPFIQLLLSMMERVTSATNYFQGSAPSRPNAPRTFGATAAIIQEGQINFDLHIQRFQNSMYEIAYGIKDLYRHYMDVELEFMAPGAKSVRRISNSVLGHDYELIFKGTSSNTNKAIRREFNQIVYMSLMQNPLIMTNPVAMYNITRRFAIAHEYLEFDQDVPEPAPGMMHAPMDQLEEIRMMAEGQNVDPLPIDNHQEHIETISMFLQSDQVVNFPYDAMPLLVAHLQQHEQMAAMMQRAQMVQPGASAGGSPSQSSQAGLAPTASETTNPGAINGQGSVPSIVKSA